MVGAGRGPPGGSRAAWGGAPVAGGRPGACRAPGLRSARGASCGRAGWGTGAEKEGKVLGWLGWSCSCGCWGWCGSCGAKTCGAKTGVVAGACGAGAGCPRAG